MYRMKRVLMSCFYGLVGLLLAGTTAAFLQSVSLWSVLTTFLVFFGMLITFVLGVYAGSGRLSPRHRRRSFKPSA